MSFVEDLSLFVSDFGDAGTLAGQAVRGIFDAASVLEADDGAVTLQPSYLLPTPASLPAVGAVLVLPAGSYAVRRVLAEPPDGAFTRLMLVRA